MLLAMSASRSRIQWKVWLRHIVKRYEVLLHVFMGIIHGMTNLGGALLAIYASATNKKKQQTRHAIAYYYLIFGISQVITLIILGHFWLIIENWSLPIISALVYMIVGNYIFLKTDDVM